MPEADFFIRQGDTASVITDVLRDENDDPVNISGATVEFHMQPIQGGAVTVNTAASNDQIASGTGHVSYAWTGGTAGNTADAGLYLAEWEVAFASGTVQTFPNTGYLLVRVTEGIA